MVLKILNETAFKLSLGCGKGTNTRGEFLALQCLLYFALKKHLTFLQVVGDSKEITNWLKKRHRIHVSNLEYWEKESSQFGGSS